MLKPVNLIASGTLSPPELVESLLQMQRAQFEDEPFGRLLLVVRAPADDDGQFVEKLTASVLKDTPVTNDSQRWPLTSEFPALPIEEQGVTDADQAKLLSELSAAPQIIVPLRPMEGRQSYLLGRGPQCPLSLSDPSISSEHARLHIQPEGVRLEDAGSKNGTRLNGRRLEAGEAPWLQPMDRVTFGRIRAFACDPRALRAVLRHDLRGLV